jgi:flavin reductase (DIM6/NTAB) family NADH-FMN oxidoreductase RutF
VVDAVVGLLIVEAAGQRNALTVSFFSESAHHPTSLWVSVRQSTLSHSLLTQTDRFSLAVLNRSPRHIAWLCGTISGRDRDKCASLQLYRSPRGFLFLHSALSSTACIVRRVHRTNDHNMFIGDIVEAEVDTGVAHRRQLLLSDLGD